MTLEEAIRLIAPAAGGAAGTWADLGAGEGLFSRALAELLGKRGRIIAVERNEAALRVLEVRASGAGGAPIDVAAGDFLTLQAIPALAGVRLDGAVFANALHFVSDPAAALRGLSARLRPGARLVVVEYDRTSANPWVPYPLPPDSLRRVAERAGFERPEVVARRPSTWHREMYCAFTVWPGGVRAAPAGEGEG